MEMEEIQTQGCSKFARISNGNGKMQNLDEEDSGGGGGGGCVGGLNISSSHGVGSLGGWPSSRIVRVSRASGGKDRHSKVLTSKGLRDRRVRLSVNTAIQFYDLQDRLGYDQPSKAVEWLLKAAAPSIAELPSLNPPFADAVADSQQLSDERRSSAGIEQQPLDSTAGEMELEADQNMQQHGGSLSKSCSSTSETSKGSGGLSLSRSESRIKARERARERAAKDKEKENESSHGAAALISSSFTELLTGTTSPSPNSSVRGGENTNFFAKSPRQWDYFTSGLLHQSATPAAYSGNTNLTNPLHHQHFSELQQFSFVSDHLAPVVTAAPGNNGNNNNHHHHHHNLNFRISPSSGFNNRGTLQSNSSSSSSPSSLLPHFQRFPPIDGSSSSPSFFTISAAPPNANAVENHHNFLSGFDARLQLYYGEPHAASHRHSDHKGKDKS